MMNPQTPRRQEETGRFPGWLFIGMLAGLSIVVVSFCFMLVLLWKDIDRNRDDIRELKNEIREINRNR